MAVKSSMRSTRASSVVSDDDDELYAGDSELNTSATDLLRIINSSTKSVQSMMTKGASAGNISVGKHIDDLAHAVKLLESVGLQSQFDLRNCDGPDTDCDNCREALTKVWDPRCNDIDSYDDGVDVEEEPVANASKKSEGQPPSVTFATTRQVWEPEYPAPFPSGANPVPVQDFSVRSAPYTRVEPSYPRSASDNYVPPKPTQSSVNDADGGPRMRPGPVSQSQAPVDYTDYGVHVHRGPKPRISFSEVPGPTARQSESSARTDTKVRFSQSSRIPPPPPPEWSDHQRSNMSNRSYTTRDPHNLATGVTYRDDAGGRGNSQAGHSDFSGGRNGFWGNHNTRPIRV